MKNPEHLPRPKPDVVIVGTGAVASRLSAEMAASGYPIAAIVSRSLHRASELAQRVGASAGQTLEMPLPPQSRLFFVGVPDDAIASVAAALAASDHLWSETTVAHTSGALTSEALAPLAGRGARTLSFHPMQSFSGVSAATVSGTYVGIEGDDRAARLAFRVAEDLGATPISIPKDRKKSYHLAAAMASNLLVALVSAATDVMESVGMSRREAVAVLRPLIRQTAENTTASLPENALTGPAARGDMNTIRFHFETLSHEFPEYAPLYRALTEEAVKIALNSGRIAPEKANSIRSMLRKTNDGAV